MRPLPFAPPLYLITDRKRFAVPPLGRAFSDDEWRVLDAAIGAGVGAVQLREKDLDGRELYERAALLAERCRSAGVKFMVNDRADVARGAGADGVQLPAAGLPVDAARALLGPAAAIGCSVHDASELVRSAGCDFVLFGPVYDTPAKRAFGPPQGVAALAAIARAATVPVIAVGGIVAERVGEVLEAGASGVAVIGAVLDAPDAAAMVRRIASAITDRRR